MTAALMGLTPEPLTVLFKKLGIADKTSSIDEDLERVVCTSDSAGRVSREKATGLELGDYLALPDAYGDAFDCTFRLGAAEVFRVCPGVTQLDLEAFRSRANRANDIDFSLELKKRKLLEQHAAVPPRCRPFLFLFRRAFEQLLDGGLQRLEELWGDQPDDKVLLVLPWASCSFDGARLALIGGPDVQRWTDFAPSQATDADQADKDFQELIETARTSRREVVRWEKTWVDHLTPFHLRLRDPFIPQPTATRERFHARLWRYVKSRLALFTSTEAAPPAGDQDVIWHQKLALHQVNLVALYIANRSEPVNGTILVTFQGASQSARVELGAPSAAVILDARAGACHLAMLADWIFREYWSTERLQLTQLLVTQMLQGTQPEGAYSVLLDKASALVAEAEGNWSSLIKGKVESYSTQVRALEDYIIARVQAVNDQVSVIVKSVSDAMLAAVGVVIASFIAALLKDNPNPTILGIGLVLYAIYVALFPGFYNMLDQRMKFNALQADINDQIKTFEDRLGKTRVTDIIGQRLERSRGRFRRWFFWTVIIYVLITLLSLGSGFSVLTDRITLPAVPSSPTATPSGTGAVPATLQPTLTATETSAPSTGQP